MSAITILSIAAAIVLSSASSPPASTSISTIIDWNTGPGTLVKLAAGRDRETGLKDIWGIGANKVIYTCKLPCDEVINKWSEVSSQSLRGGNLTDITSNYDEIWGVNDRKEIFRCNRPCTGSWSKVNGLLVQLSAGPEVLWGVNHNNDVFRTIARPNVAVSWELKSNSKKFMHVSVGQDGTVWAILEDGRPARYRPQKDDWEPVSGLAKSVHVGSRFIFAITEQKELWRCARPCLKGNWEKVSDSIDQVSVSWLGPNELHAISDQKTVLRGSFNTY